MVREFAREGIALSEYTKDDDDNLSRRGSGIKRYLREHQVDRWFVIDDIDFPDFDDEIQKHLILTDPADGLCIE